MILPRGLDTHHVPYAFDDAHDGVVAPYVRTYRALWPIRNHHTCPAVADIGREPVYSGSEMVDILGRLAEQMKHKTQCAA